MAGYLLLRSNKESGPFALQELITLGLKPYDLVWLEGKSAAWRYPGEIAELKPYAPIVEEQPYDRFYKKTNQQIHFHETDAAKQNVKTVDTNTTPLLVDAIAIQRATNGEVATIAPGKCVFVAMPAMHDIAGPPKPKLVKYSEPVIEEQLSAQTRAVTAAPATIISKKSLPETTALEEKYSMPLDDIKQLYIDNMLQQKTKKGARVKLGSNNNVVMFLSVSAFFALVIVVGSMLSERNNKMVVSVPLAVPQEAFIGQKTDDAQRDRSGDAPLEKEINEKQVILSKPKRNVQSKQDGQFLSSRSQTVKSVTENNKTDQKHSEYENQPGAVPLPSLLDEAAAAGNDTPAPIPTLTTPEKNESEPSKATGKNPTKETVYTAASYPATPDPEKTGTKKKIKKLVVIDKVDYKTGLLGGIKNISVSLSNHSNYKMDLVIVDVDYLKANDNTIKTERLYFKSMLPDATLTIAAPAGQGSKIDCRITLISSKELDYLYATIN